MSEKTTEMKETYNPFKVLAALAIIAIGLLWVLVVGLLAVPYGFLARAMGAEAEYRDLADLIGSRIKVRAMGLMAWARNAQQGEADDANYGARR